MKLSESRIWNLKLILDDMIKGLCSIESALKRFPSGNNSGLAAHIQYFLMHKLANKDPFVEPKEIPAAEDSTINIPAKISMLGLR
jgi:hypothetical protein